MNYTVRQSPEAKSDLDGIVNYITARLSNPKAATDLADIYYQRLLNFRESPRLYPFSQSEELARRGYRHFAFGNYIAYYTIDDENSIVTIARIFYRKQDYAGDL